MDAPAVCERCLGEHPYIEMTREKNSAQCKLCTRPFTVYQWIPKRGSKPKRTVICQTCARAKNCCQSCMLDLSLGMDTHTRDKLMQLVGEREDAVVHGAQNEISRIYNANQLEKRFAREGSGATSAARKSYKLLEKVDKIKDTVKVNSARKRRDVKVSKAELVKLCKKLPFNGNLNPPANDDARTLFVFGVSDTPNYELERYFNDLVGERCVDAVTISNRGQFGYVKFTTRSFAETTARKLAGDVTDHPALAIIGREPTRVCWAGTIVSGSDYSREDLDKISQIVRMQLKKLATKDRGANKSTLAKRTAHPHKAVKKRKVYKTMATDFEL